MAFVVEDGTGLETANSYVDVAFANAYFDERGICEWEGESTEKEYHLIQATDYVDQRWGHLIKGKPLVTTQALEVPRYGARDRYGQELNGVPTSWKRGVCEYALASLKGELYPSTSNSDAKEVKKKKTVVGPITTELEYSESSASNQPLKFPLADKLIRPLIGSTGNTVYR